MCGEEYKLLSPLVGVGGIGLQETLQDSEGPVANFWAKFCVARTPNREREK